MLTGLNIYFTIGCIYMFRSSHCNVCSLCGSILTTSFFQQQKRAVREAGGLPPGRALKKIICTAYQTSKGIETHNALRL